MKQYLLLILLLFSGCRWFSGADLPFLEGTNIPVPTGTPIFQEGFHDGCATILSARGTGFYRSRYKYSYNPKLIDNPEYRFGYSKGGTNCFNFVVSGRHTLGGSADTYIFGAGTPFSMGRGNWNDTIDYEEGTWNDPFNSGNGTNSIDGVWDILQKGKSGGNGPGGTTAAGGTVFGGHPFWGTWETNQIFGW